MASEIYRNEPLNAHGETSLFIVCQGRFVIALFALLLLTGTASGQNESERNAGLQFDYDPTWPLSARWTLDVVTATRLINSDPFEWKLRRGRRAAIDFMRAFALRIYGVRIDRIIGGELKRESRMEGNRLVVWRLPEIDAINDHDDAAREFACAEGTTRRSTRRRSATSRLQASRMIGRPSSARGGPPNEQGVTLMSDYLDPAEWSDLLAGFSDRNRRRRARFETFGQGNVVEEEQEAHLENIKVALTGSGAPRVTVTRLDNSTATPAEMVTTIPRVRRLSPQFDVDDSEDGLEIEDQDGALTVLRLESKVDGAS